MKHWPSNAERRLGETGGNACSLPEASASMLGDKHWVRRLGWVLAGFTILGALAAAEQPPRSLIREIAANGSLFEKERAHYTYQQQFTFHELSDSGTPLGSYREVREIVFSPEGERSEEFVGEPTMNLKRIRLTEEDFRDIRDVQPFVLTKDSLWKYELIYKGTEQLDSEECYVYRLRPRQVLEGQRLLDGLIWVSQKHRQIVKIAGRPVPQIRRTKQENLFAQFTTIFKAVDGKYWFPVKTYAEDFLGFRSGPQQVRYTIEYEKYKRFRADSTIIFKNTAP